MRVLPVGRPHLRPAGLQRLGGWRPERRLSCEGLGTHVLPRTGREGRFPPPPGLVLSVAPMGPYRTGRASLEQAPALPPHGLGALGPSWDRAPQSACPPAPQPPSEGGATSKALKRRSQQCSQDQGERETGVSQTGGLDRVLPLQSRLPCECQAVRPDRKSPELRTASRSATKDLQTGRARSLGQRPVLLLRTWAQVSRY